MPKEQASQEWRITSDKKNISLGLKDSSSGIREVYYLWEMSLLENLETETKYMWFYMNKFEIIWNIKLILIQNKTGNLYSPMLNK